MVQIIDQQDTGKTKRLLFSTNEKGVVVCKHPNSLKEKAEFYGITGLEFISYYDYKDFMEENKGIPVYIDEIEDFVKTLIPELKGYNLTQKTF